MGRRIKGTDRLFHQSNQHSWTLTGLEAALEWTDRVIGLDYTQQTVGPPDCWERYSNGPPASVPFNVLPSWRLAAGFSPSHLASASYLSIYPLSS
jgi:hypothetical protein